MSPNAITSSCNIANRLFMPQTTQAILWDMDGVLVDSLTFCLNICNQLLAQQFGDTASISDNFVRSIFAYHVPEFWRRILEHLQEKQLVTDAQLFHNALCTRYNQARLASIFTLNPGILEILQTAKTLPLKMAVVSNNPTHEVQTSLAAAGILDYFDVVIGNDLATLAKKPAPDTYLFAAQTLKVNPQDCVVIEDSLIGAEAGHRAGCYTVGVATGGTDFSILEASGWTNCLYSAFKTPECAIQFGDVRNKRILTANDFVSHALEHIAWRLGVEIQLNWQNNDWLALGEFVGTKIRQFNPQQFSAATLGMIDDGSAEAAIDLNGNAELVLKGIDNLDLDWFLALRCEQLTSGKPLIELMQGLAIGLQAKIEVLICSVQDPHHTWEGVFRALGITLNKLFTPRHFAPDLITPPEINSKDGELRVMAKSLHFAQVFRGTAESHVKVTVDFSQQMPNHFSFHVSPTINVSELPELLNRLVEHAGFTLAVEYHATVLNSSHVVLEDTALVLGRALLEILMLRMQHWGVNGAGSSVQTLLDLQNSPIHTGISVEGRKFWLFVPFKISHPELRKNFLMGQTIYQHLRSEDLDDFLDGLAGGLTCSIIVHIHELIDANQGWQLIFSQLGQALKEVFAFNPYRKGVPPGVKATLA